MKKGMDLKEKKEGYKEDLEERKGREEFIN